MRYQFTNNCIARSNIYQHLNNVIYIPTLFRWSFIKPEDIQIARENISYKNIFLFFFQFKIISFNMEMSYRARI